MGSVNSGGCVALVEIQNYADLVARCGLQTAQAVQAEVRECAVSAGGNAQVRDLGQGLMTLTWPESTGEHPGARHDVYLAYLLVKLRATQSCAKVSARFLCRDSQAAVLSFDEGAQASLDAMVADVEAAQTVRDTIMGGGLGCVFQPVCAMRTPHRVLYYECLARVHTSSEAMVRLPGTFVPSLERLGLIYCLDRHMMHAGLATLARHPDIALGVNLSAKSALDQAWWNGVLVELAEQPQLARRLVIEFTETARMPEGPGRVLAQRLQKAGCRVAIDDFGAGHGEDTLREVVHPDIVKIDRTYVEQAEAHPKRLAVLQHMVERACELGALVVIEGVRSASTWRIAQQVGAHGVQGYFVGEPRELPSGPTPVEGPPRVLGNFKALAELECAR